MAALKPGKHQGEWRAYYWDRAANKQVWVPTEISRDWTGLSLAEATEKLEEWVAGKGIQRIRSKARSLLLDDSLSALIKAFLTEHEAMRETRQNTRDTLEHHLTGHVTDYFVKKHGSKDVTRWWRLTAGFPMWLRTTYPKQKVTTTKKICQTLRRFGEYLATHHVIPQPWLIPLPKVRQRATTPLLKAITEQDALEVAAKLPPQWAIMVLCGFFASLRPEEIYALEKSDFITGARAKSDAKTYKRFHEKMLGSGLSINISKATTRDGPQELPKTHYSYGVVNIWSVTAAKAIARLVSNLGQGRIFGEVSRPIIDTEYREIVLPILGANAQDLRRASGLYLARTLGIDPFLLQDHLRHSSLSTTLLYTRRPTEQKETADTQNFNDVG